MAGKERVHKKQSHWWSRFTRMISVIGAAAACTPLAHKDEAPPLEIKIDDILPGEQRCVMWGERTVWIIRRTESMLKSLMLDSNDVQQPSITKNLYRSVQSEFLVLFADCPDCDGVPHYYPEPDSIKKEWPGGFVCECGSQFDLAGRISKGGINRANLAVPKHAFIEDVLVIGRNFSVNSDSSDVC